MTDKVICDKSDLVNIADAVRSKLGVTDTYYVSELSSAIQSIQTGGGGGVETCNLTTKVGKAPDAAHGTIYAYNGDTLITITSKGTYSINKNSLIYIYGSKGLDSYAGLEIIKATPAAGVTGTKLCNVTSDIATYTFS